MGDDIINLLIKYMGLELKNPIIVGSFGLIISVKGICQCVEDRATAVQVYSALYKYRIDYLTRIVNEVKE